MEKLISIKSYNDSIVRIRETKLNEFLKTQDFIKSELVKGKTEQEVLLSLKKGKKYG